MDRKIVSAVVTIFVSYSFTVLVTEANNNGICFINNTERKYDGRIKVCCGGKLQRKRPYKHCCKGADQFYFSTEKICCGMKVYNRFEDGVERACCGEKVIRRDTSVCCGETVLKRPVDGVEHMMCCGKELVNRTTTMCCMNDDDPKLVRQHARLPNYSCCGHIPLDLTKDRCMSMNGAKRVISHNQDICEGQIISLRKQTCCNGKIYDAPKKNPENLNELNPRVACCGTTGFDPTTDKCCPHYSLIGQVIPKDNQLQCCKNAPHGYINITHQLCCRGRSVTRTSKHSQCCGIHQINPATQGCCNHQPFNKRTHFCCRGLPSGILEQGKTCCGGKELGENSLCCDNTFQVVRKLSTDDKCCLNYDLEKYSPYTSSEMDCHEGQLESRSRSDDDICVDTRYSKTKAVCCNGRVHNFPVGDTLGCCKGPKLTEVPYSERHQICCSGVVHNMSVNEAECCRDKAYSKMNAENNPCLEKCGNSYHYKEATVCCGRQIFAKKNHGDECCGNKPYFTQTQICCEDKIHNTTEGRCCGSELYNPDSHRCCGGYEVIKRKSKTERCCWDLLAFKKRHGRCKENGLVEPKKKVTAIKSICKQKTWENLSGIEVEVCARTSALQCTLLKKKYKKKSFEFTMKCRNLALPYVSTYYKPTGLKKDSKLKVRITSGKIRCRVKKNEEVIIFLDKQPTAIPRRKRQYQLQLTDADAFRVISDNKVARQMINKVSSQQFCQRIFNYMTEDELYEYFKQRW